MKYLLKAAALSLTTVFASTAMAERMGLTVHLADETARIGVISEAEWMQEIYRFEAGFQYNTNKDYIVDASILYTNKGMVDPNLDVGFKAKAALAAVDAANDNTIGILLGIYGRYWLPTPVPSAIVAEYLLSPQIITFGDADSMREYSLRYQLQLLRNLNGFVGYRYFEVDGGNTVSKVYEDGMHFGVELTF